MFSLLLETCRDFGHRPDTVYIMQIMHMWRDEITKIVSKDGNRNINMYIQKNLSGLAPISCFIIYTRLPFGC